jgi:hypothetical protein
MYSRIVNVCAVSIVSQSHAQKIEKELRIHSPVLRPSSAEPGLVSPYYMGRMTKVEETCTIDI